MKLKFLRYFTGLLILTGISSAAQAALVTDPNDPRSWQGASVGTFATLYYGTNTAATRQQVVDNKLLDDSYFNSNGFTTGSLVATSWATGGGGGCLGTSTGAGFGYSCNGSDVFTNADAIDNLWFQSSGTIGDTVFDLGFQANSAAVFNSIDHGPLPQEAIESTVYLSNDQITWTQAVVLRVWLEGFESDLGIVWDGFTYAVGTGTTDTFRFASVIHGGPGALINDGDDEINGVMGLRADLTPISNVPVPAAIWLFGSGLIGLLGLSRKKKAQA